MRSVHQQPDGVHMLVTSELGSPMSSVQVVIKGTSTDATSTTTATNRPFLDNTANR